MPAVTWVFLSGMCFTPSVPLCHINNLCIHLSAVHFELYIYGTVHFSWLKINEHAFLITNKHLAAELVIGNRFIFISVYVGNIYI